MKVDSYRQVYRRLTEGAQRVEKALIASRRQQVLRSVERHSHRTVLEIGCGLDPLFCHYNSFSTHVTIEPVPEFAAHATVLAAGRSNVTILEGFLQSSLAKLSGETYDVVVASGLLHEVPDAVEFLRVVAQLCSPTTLFHLNVPNMRSFHRLLAQQMGLIPDVFEPSDLDRQLGHAAWFDKDRLFSIVKNAGFEVLDFGTYFIKPLSHAQLEAAMEQKIVSMQILDGLAKMSQFMPDLGAEMFVDLRRLT